MNYGCFEEAFTVCYQFMLLTYGLFCRLNLIYDGFLPECSSREARYEISGNISMCRIIVESQIVVE
jgi:hypothetical protein